MRELISDELLRMMARLAQNADGDTIQIATRDLLNLALELGEARDLLGEADHMLRCADIFESQPRVSHFCDRLKAAMGQMADDGPIDNLYEENLRLEDEIFELENKLKR